MQGTEKAIRRAIGAGFTPKKINHNFEWDTFGVTDNFQVSKSECLINPEFWKCLGNAEGWYYADHFEKTPEWKDNWHDLIDHIAQGGTPDEFFNNLLK